jgi:hypothetical protein
MAPDGNGGVTVVGVVSVFPVMSAGQHCGRHERPIAVRLNDAGALTAIHRAKVG